MHNPNTVTGTRGQILAMLRLGPRTVGNMAGMLHLTENAIRAHLSAFETEGLVRRSGVLPGVRKPFVIYELTPEGEGLFPKAYGAILAELLRVLEENLPANVLEAVCAEAGRRLAKSLAPGYRSLSDQDRVRLALDVLASIGGVAEVTRGSDSTIVTGRSCPIAEAVVASSSACQVTQSLISAITGLSVMEKCDKGVDPKCCFELRAG